MITSSDKQTMKRFYSLQTTSRPRSMDILSLTREIENLRDNPKVFPVRNEKTHESVTLRKVIFVMSARRTGTAMVLLSDGDLIVSPTSWNYYSSQEYADDKGKRFSTVDDDIFWENRDLVVSDLAYGFIFMDKNSLAKGSLLDVASHCIAMSTVEKSPSISDKDVLKFLISGSRVAFLDQNLMINGVTLDVAHANSRSVSGYYSFDRGRGRRGEDQRADGVLDNLIFKSVSHHIKTNFTSGDLMRLEYDEMLRDYRMRLPVKEMIVNWINFDEGNSNGN